MYYAGIGSRKTPKDILEFMSTLASCLAGQLILRSGGAAGADSAFEQGARRHNGECHIWRPQHATPEAIQMASKHHPAWNRCKDYTRQLHGRNCHILLGRKLDNPVKFVICWTPDAQIIGGTGMALRVALEHRIPIFNLAIPENIKRWDNWMYDNPPF
jgi:hypothetical protein